MRLVQIALALVLALLGTLPPVASAQETLIDPLDIAIRLEDFPAVAGFHFMPENSSYGDLPDGSGKLLQTWFVSGDGANLMALNQNIFRVNPPLDPGMLLRQDRAEKLASGDWVLAIGGTNDDSVSSLRQIGKRGVGTFRVGFANADFVVWTTVIGDAAVVDLSDAVSVARLSSARLDAELSRSGARGSESAPPGLRSTAPAPVSGVVESHIRGDFEGWDGDTVFELDNGQIWQQASYSYTYSYSYRPRVVIYRSDGGFRMKVDGVSETITVRRIK